MDSSKSPRGFLLELSGQLLLIRCVGLAADCGIADYLANGPRSCAELAEHSGLSADAIYRILRFLASHEIFREEDDGRFALTPRAACLQQTAANSLHALFASGWQNLSWDTLRALPSALRVGENAFEQAHGEGFFDYLATHPRAGAAFDQAMAMVAAAENPVIAENFDFTNFRYIADIGGGQGGLLAAILQQYPSTRGMLFDQAQVLEKRRDLETTAVQDRCELIAGDFFDSVPSGADLYLLKRILHDWDDAAAINILQNCRAVLEDEGCIAVIDAVIEPGNDPDPNKATDVSLLALTQGRERTAEQYAALLKAADLRLTHIHRFPPPATLSLVQGLPA